MAATAVVVDASVVLKWLFNEEDRKQAVALLEQYQNRRIHLLAPQLLVSEVGNALWKRAIRGLLDPQDALELFNLFLQDVPTLLDATPVPRIALRIALASNRSFYDSLYLALATDQSCGLITADEKFFNAVNKSFPLVKLLKYT